MQLADEVGTATSVFTGANVNMTVSAAEQSMIMPSHAQVSKGAMLRLDDELAGLIEAADTLADQGGAHPTRPEPASPVAGELSLAQSTCADASAIYCAAAQPISVLCCAVLCCAVLCCAVLCCAVLCCAVLCCAVLCCAVLCCAVL